MTLFVFRGLTSLCSYSLVQAPNWTDCQQVLAVNLKTDTDALRFLNGRIERSRPDSSLYSVSVSSPASGARLEETPEERQWQRSSNSGRDGTSGRGSFADKVDCSRAVWCMWRETRSKGPEKKGSHPSIHCTREGSDEKYSTCHRRLLLVLPVIRQDTVV